MKNRKHWVVKSTYDKDFLKNVKSGDMVSTDYECGNYTWMWCDELDRPQKPILDENGKMIRVTLDYEEQRI